MTRTHTHILSANDPLAIPQAIEILQSGELVAFPTDTVYGLGTLPNDLQGLARLYTVKGRDSAKAIPILVGARSDLPGLASQVTSQIERLAERFWPGPLTLVVSRHASLPQKLSPYPTVGLRMPNHPITLAILRITGPLAVSSANLSNQPSASTAEEVYRQLGGLIPLIIDGGRTPGGLSSTVVDCSGPELKILRPGPISLQELLEALT